MGVVLSKPRTAALALASVTAVHLAILRPLYNLFFHPLSKYPGPTLWAMYRFPLSLGKIGGYSHKTVLDLHNRYGDVVRVAPNELSFVRPEAWKEIMGYRKAKENIKDPIAHQRFQDNILGADREMHGQLRRNLSHGFSARRILEQEPLIQGYIDLLIQRLDEHTQSSQSSDPVDISAWFNFTTFDVIGDLSFGDSFHSLETATMHPWIALMFNGIKQAVLMNIAMTYIPGLWSIIPVLMPSAVSAIAQHEQFGRDRVNKRLEIVTDRPDFIDSMTRVRDQEELSGKERPPPLTLKQLQDHAALLVLAGSETTATVLSFTIYLLCKNPHVMRRAMTEVDDHFAKESEIDITACQTLEYLLAVLNESMRLFPAAAALAPRVTPPGGAEVFGDYLPENTKLGITQNIAFRYPGNFALADEYHPERWLSGDEEDPRFINDRKDVFQPFSHGPRDCIAKNLAYAEMRVILTRMLFNFDFKLNERSENWTENLPCWGLWDKGPLWVHISEREH